MRYRDYKKYEEGAYYHIYNRGNEKRNIFLDDSDFQFFLTRLQQCLSINLETLKVKSRIQPLPKNSFSLVNYCLMPNHFHLLIRQNTNIPSSKLLSKLCTSYSKYFNKKYERTGHLFQDQFKQSHIDNNKYLLWLSAYIHQNPKTANLVSNPEDYYWSSYREFIENLEFICEKDFILNQFASPRKYKEFVESSYEIIKNNKDLENLFID